MHVWNVLHAACWKYRTQKIAKKLPYGPIAQLCLAVSLQLRHVLTIRKKLLKQQYLLHTFSEYGRLRPTTGWDPFGSFGHPSTFQWASRFGFITAATSLSGRQQNFAGYLAIFWAGTLCMHFWGSCPLTEFLPAATFTLHPSLAFSYIGSITARHSSSGRQPNFVPWFKQWS